MKTIPSQLRAAALSALLLLASCGTADSPTGVDARPSTQRGERVSARTNVAVALTPVRSAAVQPVAVSAVIGISGGELHAGPHMLSVPAGAVRMPTLFTMQVLNDGYVHVELKAYAADLSGAYTVSVGELGFLKPVVLKMSYESVVDAVGPERLRVAWLLSGSVSGPLVAQPSTFDVNRKWIIGRLDHFSGYILGSGSDTLPDTLPNLPN